MEHKLFARKNLLLLAVLAAELVWLLLRFGADYRTGSAISLSGSQLSPYADACVVEDTAVSATDFTGQFATTPWLDIAPGSYRVAVSYENTGADGSVGFVSEIMPTARYDAAVLPAGRSGTVFSLWMPNRCEDAQLRFVANGSGTLRITGIQLIPTHGWAYTRFLTALLALVLLDWLGLVLLGRLPLPGKTLRARYTVLALLGITAFACLPLGCDYLVFGHDLSIHLTRIEGLAAGLQAGQFPVRLYPAMLNDKGYPFGLMYADLLLYPAALLRIIGFSLQAVYKLYVLAVTAATAWVSWWCVKKIFSSDRLALLGAAVYTLSAYRLSNVFARAAVGEYTAMLFLPLVVYGFWRIYAAPRGRRDWLALAVGFTGLLQTHLLTLEMVGLLSVLLCLVLARRTFTRGVLGNIGKAAGATLLCNLWYLAPLLSYLSLGACAVGTQSDALSLYQSAAFPAQLFAMFGDMSGRSYPLSAGMSGEQPFTVGTALALAAGLFLLCVLDPAVQRTAPRAGALGGARSHYRAGALAFGFGALCLWLASDSFPWYRLSQAGGTVSALLGKLQFAWRFVSPATVCLWLCGCCALFLLAQKRMQFARAAGVLLLVLTLLPAGWLLYDSAAASTVRCYESLAAVDNLSEQIGNGEYLPTGLTTNDTRAWADNEPHFDAGLAVDGYEKTGLTIRFAVQNSGDTAAAQLPLFYYPGYTARGSAGQTLAVSSAGGFLSVAVPAGYSGTVTVRFAGLWFWRVCDCISLAAVLAGLGWALHAAGPPAFLRRRRAQR